MPAIGAGHSLNDPVTVVRIKIGNTSTSIGNLHFEYIKQGNKNLDNRSVALVEDTVVAVD